MRHPTDMEVRQHSEVLDHAVRFGLVAYGIVHLMIAWLAAQIAVGGGGGDASGTGALHELAAQPFGGVLVWAVAIGMGLLVGWRLIEATQGDELPERAGSVLKALIYGALAVSAVKVAAGAGSSGKGTDGYTATVMGWPAGTWLVGLVGLSIIGYGAFTAWRGWSEKFLEHLDAEGQSGDSGTAYTVFGKVGYIAKGSALAVVGSLFVYAAVQHDPKQSGGLDQALREVLQRPFGPVMLLAIAGGLGCYGLFCFARARHLDR